MKLILGAVGIGVVVIGQFIVVASAFFITSNGDWSVFQLTALVLDAVFIIELLRRIKARSGFYRILLFSIIGSVLLFFLSTWIVRLSDSIMSGSRTDIYRTNKIVPHRDKSGKIVFRIISE